MNSEISLCKKTDLPKLMEFIDTHWKNGHIMGSDKEIMDFCHKNAQGDWYNFLLTEENEKITGTMGFINTSHYDNALEHEKDVWLVIWKSISSKPGVGFFLLKELINSNRTIGAIGINDNVAKLYKILGFTLGHLFSVLHSEQ